MTSMIFKSSRDRKSMLRKVHVDFFIGEDLKLTKLS